MFCLSSAGIISITRGDTACLPITLHDGTSIDNWEYHLNEKDELYFGLMEPNTFFEQAIVRKKYTFNDLDANGTINIILNPEDTECLLPGLYYYQIKVRLYDPASGNYLVNTVLPKTQFWIEE